MKIVIIGPAYPFRGGIADTNESFCRSLINLGHEAQIITFTLQYPNFLFPGKTQFSEDAPPKSTPITRKISTINPISWISAAKHINKIKPDIVVIRYFMPFFAPSLGFIARRLKSCTKLAFCDNIIPHENRIGDHTLTSYFVKPFDGFVTLSQKVKNEIRQFSSKKVMYLPHPINDNLGNHIDKTEAIKHLNLDSNQKHILFFGLIRKYKGLDLLIQAMSDERIRKLNVKLVVAGEFYDSKDEYDKLVSSLGLEKIVLFTNGFVALDDIKYYFGASDLIAQTYKTASQSGVTQIAFHFNRPSLVTNVGGLGEIIDNGRNGHIAEPNVDDIASKIVEFYNSKDVDYERHVAEDKVKYSWETFSQSMIEFSQSL